jgi:hypothetical protein
MDTITDSDVGDSVNYSVKMPDGSALPSWLSFDGATRTFSGTPDVANVGALQFVLWGTDNYGYAAGEYVNMTIDTATPTPMQTTALGNQYHVEQFKTSDGKTLLDSQVQNLVSAMAGFAPPAAGQTTLSASYATALAPVIAANWQ